MEQRQIQVEAKNINIGSLVLHQRWVSVIAKTSNFKVSNNNLTSWILPRRPLLCTLLTAVINFESVFFLLFLLAIKPDTQDYSFVEFSQSVFSSPVGLAWLEKLKDQWERILLLKTVSYNLFFKQDRKIAVSSRDNALQNCKYVHICWRKFADFIFS